MANQILERIIAQTRLAFPDRITALQAGMFLPIEQSPELVYFPLTGLISIVLFDGARSIDTAFVGREGMVGLGFAHVRQGGPARAVVRADGRAIVIPADVLRRALDTHPALWEPIRGYAQLCLEQASHAIYAASRSTIEQRLARWLLMAHNRIDADAFEITHETVADALGVRRPGITVALHLLEGRHAIKATRGLIAIRSREALIASAGSAYRDVFYGQSPEVEPSDRLSVETKAARKTSNNMSLSV